jgi:hypothetical protein
MCPFGGCPPIVGIPLQAISLYGSYPLRVVSLTGHVKTRGSLMAGVITSPLLGEQLVLELV